jgi:protein O-GlcNAc transferase
MMVTSGSTPQAALLAIDEAFGEAVARQRSGELLLAEEIYQAILKLDPLHAKAIHNLGVLKVQMGQAEAGLPYLAAALEADPACRQYWISYTDALLQDGQLEAAGKILSLAQEHGLAGEDVDALAFRAGAGTGHSEAPCITEKAEFGQSSQKVVSVSPSGKKARPKGRSGRAIPPARPTMGPAPAETALALALFNREEFVEAAAEAREITERFPKYGLGWKILGAVYSRMGRNADALGPMQKAAVLLPKDAEAHLNLGVEMEAVGQLEEAVASYQRVTNIMAGHPHAYARLGRVQYRLGRFREAQAAYRRALEINPESAELYWALGVISHKEGRPAEAVSNYRRAIQICPTMAEAHSNLSAALRDMGSLVEAEVSAMRALELQPDYAEAHSNLGILLLARGRTLEADAHCRRAVELVSELPEVPSADPGTALVGQIRLDEAPTWAPRRAEVYHNLGHVLIEQGRLDEAIAAIRTALEIQPNNPLAYNNLLFALNYHPDKREEEIYAAYREYDEKFGKPLRGGLRGYENDRATERRLKVGYVSPDFSRHAVMNFLEPLLANHDKARVDVYAYAELKREDEATARYRNYADHWVETRGMTGEELTQRIRADGIDVLVDVAGHTAGNRLEVFARKPAPVSASWLGYGYTTGLSAIDYFLTDELCVPAGSERLFAEGPWRLPVPSLVYRPAQGMGEVSPLPALERGYVTFGTLTRAVRINYRTIRAWAEILKRVEASRLLIDSRNFQDEGIRDSLVAQFANQGIERDRLEIGFHSPPWDVLRGMDIGLDCFPHNSGTTLFETLYMGVPYVSLAGRPSVGRLGGMILKAVGHPEWVAQSEEEYIEKVVALAADTEKLSGIRRRIRGEMDASPLRDEAGFARQVEKAYREMWIRWSAMTP